MATASKLVPMKPKPLARGASPLTPELKEFIDRAIVPALVRQCLAEIDAQKTLETGLGTSRVKQGRNRVKRVLLRHRQEYLAAESRDGANSHETHGRTTEGVQA
jgi:hypothetical protein